jgi:predicted AAA+ superfamily ATPase
MLSREALLEVIEQQNKYQRSKSPGISREQINRIEWVSGYARIVTGVRRCGKSTLLLQRMMQHEEDALFINFEDPRLADFSTADFRLLDHLLLEKGIKSLFLDEIQTLKEWERYVRQKLDEGFQLAITGSNASLLSKELGTKLTGRHLSTELFPFSYGEFLHFLQIPNDLQAVQRYLRDGGFPDYLRTSEPAILQQLLDDIILRDIAQRYQVRDVQSLRKLAVYLISNIGKPVSANNLASTLQLSAVSTMLEYFAYLEDAYIVQFLSRFSYSQHVEMRNPKKVYAIDMGLFTHNSVTFSDEAGRRLENTVFLHYRRRGNQLHYFKEKKECDFVVSSRGKVLEVVQVCYSMNEDNFHREMDGLKEAMRFFKLEKGLIVTLNQRETYEDGETTIELIPIDQLLLSMS